MKFPKEEAIRAISSLPDDAPIDDVMYRLYVEDKILRGQNAFKESFYDYIALDSKFYAKTTINNIIQRTLKLSETPEIGRVVPELSEENVREVLIYSYRLIYQITPDKIVVLAVIHGFRNLHCEDIPVVR